MSEDLKYAISQNNLKKIQEILCTYNVDLNSRYYNPLLQACVKGSPVIVGALIKAGANVNVRVSHDKIKLPKYGLSLAICSNESKTVTPLIFGVVDRNLELVKKLLQDCGADVNGANDAALTPLHFIPTNDIDLNSTAKAQVKPKIAELLLKAGAEVNACDRKGQTPLHRAVIAKDLVFTNLLLKAGADVNLRDGERKTPLHYAVTAKHLDSTRVLLENGARVDIADKECSTALHIAARALNTQICQLLIQHEGGKTAVNHKACDGATPLHVAIESRIYAPDKEKRAVVQLLIDNGADLTSQKHGLTPLHLAAEDMYRPLDIVKMLVEAGADIRAEALKTGLTPLDMAKHTKKQDVVDYLVARAEKDNEEGGRPKRDPPSVEPQQTDTPVEDIAGAVGGFQLLNIKAEDSVVHVEGLGAVGGFQQLVIKDEDSSDDDL